MKGYSILILLLSCAGCMGQITLTSPSPITEGAETAIVVTCTAAPAVVVDMTFRLVYDAATSSSENGFDHSPIENYACTILAGQTVGTVSIPLIDDVQLDIPTTGESLAITVNTADLGAYAAGAALAVVIMDSGGTPDMGINIVPRQTVYKGTEGMMVGIVLDFVDVDGKPAPLEETLNIDLTTPTSMTDSAVAADFTDPNPAALTYTPGTAETSATVMVALIADTTVENLEAFNVQLADMPAATDASITATGAPIFQVHIADIDKEELIVIHDNRTPLPRRSKGTVSAWAITNEGSLTATDLPFTYLGHNLKDFKAKIQQINSVSALELTLPRPNRNSKSRFNEYTFSREQTFGDGSIYVRTARTFLEPTNHKQGSAPIESETASVLVVYPDADPCDALDKTYTISVPASKYNGQLRWGFYPEGGTKSDFKILKNKGNTLTLTECGKAGLYVTFRVGRGKKGWLDYVRVIQADCPNGQFGPPGTCTPFPLSCKNGGTVDQALGLCCCPPGFAGDVCEIATEPGTFGSSCQFKISDYIKDNQKGKCLTVSLPDVCGVTCFAGYGGADCCKPCKKGTFGANCAQTCHCVDDACNTFSGACDNGCLPGFSGFNCQAP